MATARTARSTTRRFAVGAFTFAVDTVDEADRRIVESLFVDLPEASDATPLQGRFSLERDRRRGAWTLHGTRLERAPRRALPLDGALKQLVTTVNLCALDAEPEFLHLHAAAAAKGGRVVVMAAARETGKTTTVAHLVAHGWGFVTDETVRLRAHHPEVTGFPKPLSVKPNGRGLLGHLDPWMIPDTGPDDGFRFVPVGATGATVVRGGLPGLVVVLRRGPEDGERSPPSVRWLHPVDAVVVLMQETLDAERFGHAAVALAQLVAASPCVELTMGTPEQTVAEIEALCSRRDVPEPLEVCVYPTSDAYSPGVTTVGLGERVVVHDTVTGRIFALDEGGSRVWRQLGGWEVSGEMDLDGPVIGPFVSQLRAFGVLAGSR